MIKTFDPKMKLDVTPHILIPPPVSYPLELGPRSAKSGRTPVSSVPSSPASNVCQRRTLVAYPLYFALDDFRANPNLGCSRRQGTVFEA